MSVASGAVVVTGMGIVSAAGWSPAETWAAIEQGRSGLGPLTLFPSPRCGHVPVGQVQGDPALRSGLSRGSRSDHLAAFAARGAFLQAGLDRFAALDRQRAGVVLGGITGGMLEAEAWLEALLREAPADAALLRDYECGRSTQHVARLLGLEGFQATVSTACASGGTALSTAVDVLEAGEADVMLAGGVDALTRLTLNGFSALLIVDPEGCRPFDAGRRGMSLGEGAAVLVLETEAHARARGARVLASLDGCGNSCDAYHAAAPATDGAGLYEAMRGALAAAGLEPGDVDYVNAHGTGTVENDTAEAAALRRLFGERMPPVSSTKRFFGHALAAAGAIEAVVSILCLIHQRVPANLGLQQVDPAVGFTPQGELAAASLEVVMSNSLGFGGSNSSLVFRRAGSAPRGVG